MRLFLYIFIYLAFSAGLVFVAWQSAYREALNQLSNSAQANLSLAADRLVGRLERYRLLPVVLARNETILQALSMSAPQHLNPQLQRLADSSRSLNISLVNTNGDVIADSAYDSAHSYLGRNLANRVDFERAMNGALGFYHLQEHANSPRGFTFASPVRDDSGDIRGAIVVKADLQNLELLWRGDPETVFFADENGVIFISNRNDRLLMQLGESAADIARYGGQPLTAFPDPEARTVFSHQVWFNPQATGLQNAALLETQPLPVIGMNAYFLTSISPAIEGARLRALLVAAGMALLGALLWAINIRRSALARELVMRAEANAALEIRVEERSRQLKQAQNDLVQAGKLSALGQMAAGISHELNQPLAAIQSFSENAQVFLARGQAEKAAGNLGRIADLTERMARIIKNLRAFSKKEGEARGDVDLVRIIEDAIEIAEPRLRAEHVALSWSRPASTIIANGGAVRLQQVLLNLISNAADAMVGMADKKIIVSVVENDSAAQIIIRDTGPGLRSPEKIFEPFYTTKTSSDENGMGLGLSISYGIVQSFGGAIKGESHPDGGAIFTVTLPKGTQG